MDSGLKQRLIGAAVLVALAVIFLPLLVKGPAPDSGVSDVPLKVPDAPQGDMQTRDLPLLAPEPAPGPAPPGGAVGMPPGPSASPGQTLPMVDTAATSPDASSADSSDIMVPASIASGDYAVHFGAYASSVSADTVVSRLRAAHLPAYREAATVDGRSAFRVRVGPYATRADAESARIEAVKAGHQSGARVVALDADTAAPSASQPIAAATPSPGIQTQALPATPVKPDADKTATDKAIADKAASDKAAADRAAADKAAASMAAKTPAPAASGVGFAVQIGAFGNAAQANKKRDDLRAAGFPAFTDTVTTDKGTLTRVKAGPVVARADADKLKAQIKAKTGLDGIIRPHP